MAQIKTWPEQKMGSTYYQQRQPVLHAPVKPPSPKTVLEELFILLEDYAPVWYTDEHHDRALAALLGWES
jgi:prephenate dehydrogenase